MRLQIIAYGTFYKLLSIPQNVYQLIYNFNFQIYIPLCSQKSNHFASYGKRCLKSGHIKILSQPPSPAPALTQMAVSTSAAHAIVDIVIWMEGSSKGIGAGVWTEMVAVREFLYESVDGNYTFFGLRDQNLIKILPHGLQ